MSETIKKTDLLFTTDEYLDYLVSIIQEIVEYIQQGYEGKAMQSFLQIIGEIQTLLEAIELIKDLLVEPIDIYSIKEILVQINDAFQNKDYVLLSDLLEYEILALFEQWKDIVKSSIKAIGE